MERVERRIETLRDSLWSKQPGAIENMIRYFQSLRSAAGMKKNNPQGKPGKKDKPVNGKSINSYLDTEVSLIHHNLDELKSFLAQHAAMTQDVSLEPDARHIDDYYNSTDDLFRQVALETGSQIPFDTLCYDTYLLRKKKKISEKKK